MFMRIAFWNLPGGRLFLVQHCLCCLGMSRLSASTKDRQPSLWLPVNRSRCCTEDWHQSPSVAWNLIMRATCVGRRNYKYTYLEGSTTQSFFWVLNQIIHLVYLFWWQINHVNLAFPNKMLFLFPEQDYWDALSQTMGNNAKSQTQTQPQWSLVPVSSFSPKSLCHPVNKSDWCN